MPDDIRPYCVDRNVIAMGQRHKSSGLYFALSQYKKQKGNNLKYLIFIDDSPFLLRPIIDSVKNGQLSSVNGPLTHINNQSVREIFNGTSIVLVNYSKGEIDEIAEKQRLNDETNRQNLQEKHNKDSSSITEEDNINHNHILWRQTNGYYSTRFFDQELRLQNQEFQDFKINQIKNEYASAKHQAQNEQEKMAIFLKNKLENYIKKPNEDDQKSIEMLLRGEIWSIDPVPGKINQDIRDEVLELFSTAVQKNKMQWKKMFQGSWNPQNHYQALKDIHDSVY